MCTVEECWPPGLEGVRAGAGARCMVAVAAAVCRAGSCPPCVAAHRRTESGPAEEWG